MQVDIKNTITVPEKRDRFHIALEVRGAFMRDGPPGTEESISSQMKQLNYSQMNDCITSKKLVDFANFNCENPDNMVEGKSILIPFFQAYNKYLILGQKDTGVPIEKKVLTVEKELKYPNGTKYNSSDIIQNSTLSGED